MLINLAFPEAGDREDELSVTMGEGAPRPDPFCKSSLFTDCGCVLMARSQQFANVCYPTQLSGLRFKPIPLVHLGFLSSSLAGCGNEVAGVLVVAPVLSRLLVLVAVQV